MTRTSGWCSAPTGALPMCAGCRVLDCTHECHDNAQKPAVDRDWASDVLGSAVEIAYPEGTTKRAPDRVLGGPQSRALSRLIGVDL